jgi:hypothetical protein
MNSGIWRLSFPITAAGPYRIFTGFPIMPKGHHQVSDHSEMAFFDSSLRSRSFVILDVAMLRLRLQKRCGLGLNQKLPFLDGHKLRSMQIR